MVQLLCDITTFKKGDIITFDDDYEQMIVRYGFAKKFDGNSPKENKEMSEKEWISIKESH